MISRAGAGLLSALMAAGTAIGQGMPDSRYGPMPPTSIPAPDNTNIMDMFGQVVPYSRALQEATVLAGTFPEAAKEWINTWAGTANSACVNAAVEDGANASGGVRGADARLRAEGYYVETQTGLGQMDCAMAEEAFNVRWPISMWESYDFPLSVPANLSLMKIGFAYTDGKNVALWGFNGWRKLDSAEGYGDQ
jgi:hypothetical protein